MNFSGLTQTFTPRSTRSSSPNASAAGSISASINSANATRRGSRSHNDRSAAAAVGPAADAGVPVAARAWKVWGLIDGSSCG